MTSKRELADITGELIAPFETEMAYKFSDGDKTVWLPKSQCDWDEYNSTMTMPLWLAEEKELI